MKSDDCDWVFSEELKYMAHKIVLLFISLSTCKIM
jgi:hypothetical protein